MNRALFFIVLTAAAGAAIGRVIAGDSPRKGIIIIASVILTMALAGSLYVLLKRFDTAAFQQADLWITGNVGVELLRNQFLVNWCDCKRRCDQFYPNWTAARDNCNGDCDTYYRNVCPGATGFTTNRGDATQCR